MKRMMKSKWGKAFIGGTALKIAATAVVALGVTSCGEEQAAETMAPPEPMAAQMQEPTHSANITLPGAGRTIPYMNHNMQVLIEGGALPTDISLIQQTLPARSLGAPPHIHEGEDEFFYVLKGQVTFMDGEATIAGGPGTLAALPRQGWHAFWNAGQEDAELLLFVAPAHFTTFFDDVVAAVEAEKPQTPEEAGAIVGRLAAGYGVPVDISRYPAEALELMPRYEGPAE